MLVRRGVPRLRAAVISRCISSATRFTPAFKFHGHATEPGSLQLAEPTIFPKHFLQTPAISKWFKPVVCAEKHAPGHEVNMSYLGPHSSAMVPLEVTRAADSGSSDAEMPAFTRIHAPLSLLLAQMSSDESQLRQLYLAQCSIDDLPTQMQNDLPVPHLISCIGRGDLYASSLWMGRPPTDTPLHKDPNPNLFVQLVGQKVIRLMNPRVGRLLYERVRADCRSKGHANFRGEEMMAGEEREQLQEATWGESEVNGPPISGVEARLESGDGLFIPLGWWHAVRGLGVKTNASANWWFR